MGWIRHHTIVVTGQHEWLRTKPASTKDAHDEAARLGLLVSEIVKHPINGTSSFFVSPDGSKEGWEMSVDFDARREFFKRWLRSQAYEDGLSPLAWIEAEFGETEPKVIASDAMLREREATGEPNDS